MTKFNPDTCKKIIETLKEGHYRKTAAALAGVDETTLVRWVKRGRESKTDGKYYQFYQSVKKAEEFAKAYHLQQILKASNNGNWQASAWFLERKAPDEWGRRQRVEMEHSGEVKQQHKGKVELTVHDRIKERAEYYEQLKPKTEGDP